MQVIRKTLAQAEQEEMSTLPRVVSFRKRKIRAGYKYIGLWVHHTLVPNLKNEARVQEALRKAAIRETGK